jgi:hypothetical protein
VSWCLKASVGPTGITILLPVVLVVRKNSILEILAIVDVDSAWYRYSLLLHAISLHINKTKYNMAKLYPSTELPRPRLQLDTAVVDIAKTSNALKTWL